ncbi:MAG: hypothetical protein WCG03_06690 [Kiritimatiellales bacterium]
MKRSVLIISVLLNVFGAWAAIVTDDFNRPDTTYSTNGSAIGANWINCYTSTVSASSWEIHGNQLYAKCPTYVGQLVNTSLQTISGNGTNFILRTDVSTESNRWIGVVFNYQDQNNYYHLRIKPGSKAYQLISVKNTVLLPLMVTKMDATSPFNTNTFYTLTVTSSNAYNFGFTITQTGYTNVLNPTKTFVDTNSCFTAGYAGIFTGGATLKDPDMVFDNFYLYLTTPTIEPMVIKVK